MTLKRVYYKKSSMYVEIINCKITRQENLNYMNKLKASITCFGESSLKKHLTCLLFFPQLQPVLFKLHLFFMACQHAIRLACFSDIYTPCHSLLFLVSLQTFNDFELKCCIFLTSTSLINHECTQI